MPKPWEAFEIIYLIKNAGFYSVKSLSEHLGRECSDVENVLCSLGIDGVLVVPELHWCDSCATYRTEINAKGLCRVCQLKKSLEKEESVITDELKKLPIELRAAYSDSEALKGFRATPKRCLLKNQNALQRSRESFQRLLIWLLWSNGKSPMHNVYITRLRHV